MPSSTEIFGNKVNKEEMDQVTETGIWTGLDQTSSQASQLGQLIDQADAILVGAGAGLSAAAGFTYSGDRFSQAFPDFIAKYNFFDMLQAFLDDYEDLREYWAFQSRFALLNYFDQAVGQAYLDLKDILEGKDYHVLTTNADNAFEAGGFDMDKVFRIQGEYGLWQCSRFCHQQTYQDEALIRQMVDRQEDMKVPEDLIPYCPKCGAPLEVNKRDAVQGMVEDSNWHQQEERYRAFLKDHQEGKIVYLEIGVGVTTPQFIREPFQDLTSQNPQALYVTMNQRPYRISPKVREQAVRITNDISQVLHTISNR